MDISKDIDEFSNDGLDVTMEQLATTNLSGQHLDEFGQRRFSKEEQEQMLMDGEGEEEMIRMMEGQDMSGPEAEEALLGTEEDGQMNAETVEKAAEEEPRKTMFSTEGQGQVEQFKFNMYQAPSNGPVQFGGGMDLSLLSSNKSGDSSTLSVDNATLRRRIGMRKSQERDNTPANKSSIESRKRVVRSGSGNGTATAGMAMRRKRQPNSAEEPRNAGEKRWTKEQGQQRRDYDQLVAKKRCRQSVAAMEPKEATQKPKGRRLFTFYSSTAGLLGQEQNGQQKIMKMEEEEEEEENEGKEEGECGEEGEEEEMQRHGQESSIEEEEQDGDGDRQNELREYDGEPGGDGEDELFFLFETASQKPNMLEQGRAFKAEQHRQENNQHRARSHSAYRGPPSTQAEQSSKTTLFVCPIPFEMDEQTLRGYFVRFGQIRSVMISRDPTTGDSKGYGFISFHSEESAEDAIRHSGMIWANGAQKAFCLSWYRPRQQRLRSISPSPRRPGTNRHQGPDDHRNRSNSSIYVTGMSPNWGHRQLLDHFEQYGKVRKIEIMHAPMRVAYIRYDTIQSAIRAIGDNAGGGNGRMRCGWDRREEMIIDDGHKNSLNGQESAGGWKPKSGAAPSSSNWNNNTSNPHHQSPSARSPTTAGRDGAMKKQFFVDSEFVRAKENNAKTEDQSRQRVRHNTGNGKSAGQPISFFPSPPTTNNANASPIKLANNDRNDVEEIVINEGGFGAGRRWSRPLCRVQNQMAKPMPNTLPSSEDDLEPPQRSRSNLLRRSQSLGRNGRGIQQDNMPEMANKRYGWYGPMGQHNDGSSRVRQQMNPGCPPRSPALVASCSSFSSAHSSSVFHRQQKISQKQQVDEEAEESCSSSSGSSNDANEMLTQILGILQKFDPGKKVKKASKGRKM